MPEYIVERKIQGAGNLTQDQLREIAQKSNGILRDMGPQIQWVHSYVTNDTIYCVYRAPNEELIREHAARGGFPANQISQVCNIINPTSGE